MIFGWFGNGGRGRFGAAVGIRHRHRVGAGGQVAQVLQVLEAFDHSVSVRSEVPPVTVRSIEPVELPGSTTR